MQCEVQQDCVCMRCDQCLECDAISGFNTCGCTDQCLELVLCNVMYSKIACAFAVISVHSCSSCSSRLVSQNALADPGLNV